MINTSLLIRGKLDIVSDLSENISRGYEKKWITWMTEHNVK